MPGSFVFALLLFGIAVITAAISLFLSRGGGGDFPARLAGFGAAVVVALFALLFTVIAAYDRVDTRNVGIKTHFGRPIGTCGAGPCWHAPWDKVSELSEAIQLQAFESPNYDEASHGNSSSGAGGPAINVRLANNSNAYVDINLNWRLREGAAPKLFQDYGGGNVFDTIRQQLVDRQAQVMVSKVFSGFNPQTLLAATASTPNDPAAPVVVPTSAQGADLPKMAADVKADLQAAVGQEIEILDVRIPRLFYDGPTQSKIDAYNQKVQDTLNAQQDVKTATQQRLASEQRAMQPAPDLKVAIFNCLNEQVKQGKDPAGCWSNIGGTPLIEMPKP